MKVKKVKPFKPLGNKVKPNKPLGNRVKRPTLKKNYIFVEKLIKL
jgi:hypothetical protein